MIRVLFVFAALLFSGCRPQYSDFFPYFEDGTPKPSVALLPMFDEAHPPLQWNIAKELSAGVRKQLMKDGNLFVPSNQEIAKQLASCSQKELSGSDLMPFLFFQPSHFVVVMELIEYKLVPYEPGKIKPLYIASVSPSEGQVLQIKVRLKIVDIRGGEPKLLRQEVVQSNHVISKAGYEESLASHGEKGFTASPLGLAEGRLTKALSEKIEHITSYQH